MQTVQLSNEKCARHSQRYCPEPGCYTPLVPNTNQPAQSLTPGFEDQLVGRTEQSPTLVPKVQAEKPQPAEMLTQAAPAPQAPESQATALVQASKAYADAVAAAEKAVGVVADLEKRLEFARENAVGAINAKDESLKRIKLLIEGELNVANG
jgi:hypothetical protein